MKRSAPLARSRPLQRSAFKARAALARPPREDRVLAPCAPAVRRATYAGATSGVEIVKEDAVQSPTYQRAAKALGHCMRCGAEHVPLDFCHADLGKGKGLKTDSRRGWPGCRGCHETVGRKLARPVRRAVEYILGFLTRCEILAAGTWPANLPRWVELPAGDGDAEPADVL